MHSRCNPVIPISCFYFYGNDYFSEKNSFCVVLNNIRTYSNDKSTFSNNKIPGNCITSAEYEERINEATNSTESSLDNNLEYKTTNKFCTHVSANTYGIERNRIWRPFSCSPPRNCNKFNDLKETSYDINATNPTCATIRKIPTITPTKVKIQPSLSSSFKAVIKKKRNHVNISSNNEELNYTMLSTGKKTSPVKPYRCDFANCYKTFSRNEELTRHKRIHSGYKPHQCALCEKRFGRKDHLNKHLKTHLHVSEKKVYACCVPGCDHRYTRSDALTRHMTTAHLIKFSKDFKDKTKKHEQQK